jgi:hypothetical protein
MEQGGFKSKLPTNLCAECLYTAIEREQAI